MSKSHCPSRSLWIFVLLLPPLGILLLLCAILWRNRLPWRQNPGFRRRLQVYLNQNKAETQDDSEFPELLTPVFKTSPESLFQAVTKACQSLGWTVKNAQAGAQRVEAVVNHRLLPFKEDILISVQAVSEQWSQLYVLARARQGKADLGTNTRHILDLKRALHQELK